MSQHDMTVDNGAGLAVRNDLNLALKALASQSSGASAPSPTYPAQVWADTGTGRLRQRNAANSAWVDKGPLDLAMAPLDSPVFTGLPTGPLPCIVGDSYGAKMTVATASASATFTADEIIVKTALGGSPYRLVSYSKVINLATTGAGGMDTGTAPVNGWVALYAIFNPTTSVSSILAVASPNTVMPAVYGGANMPSGYTASALLTVVPTNGSSQFKVLSVFGRRVYIALTQAFSGNSINANTAITGVVPANAIEITSGELILQNTAASSMSLTVVSQLATSLGQQNITALINAGGALIGNFSNLPLTVAQNIGINGSSSAGTPTYSVHVSGYSI